MLTGRWSFWGFVMVFGGFACSESTVMPLEKLLYDEGSMQCSVSQQ